LAARPPLRGAAEVRGPRPRPLWNGAGAREYAALRRSVGHALSLWGSVVVVVAVALGRSVGFSPVRCAGSVFPFGGVPWLLRLLALVCSVFRLRGARVRCLCWRVGVLALALGVPRLRWLGALRALPAPSRVFGAGPPVRSPALLCVSFSPLGARRAPSCLGSPGVAPCRRALRSLCFPPFFPRPARSAPALAAGPSPCPSRSPRRRSPLAPSRWSGLRARPAWGWPVGKPLGSRSRRLLVSAVAFAGPPSALPPLPSAALVASWARAAGASAAFWRPSASAPRGAVVCCLFPAWGAAALFSRSLALGPVVAAGSVARVWFGGSRAPVLRPCGWAWSVSVPVGALPAAFPGASFFLWGGPSVAPFPCGGACGL
jgi:hypothetical protein